MTHIHVNKELTDDLESQGYHLVDKHQLARMQQLEKVAQAVKDYTSKWHRNAVGSLVRPAHEQQAKAEKLFAVLEAMK